MLNAPTSHLAVSEVKDLYDKSLFVLAKTPGQNFIICPVGYIGSGKSTVLDSLSKYLSFVRISNDAIRKLLRDRGDFDSDHARSISLELIAKYSNAGYNVAIDANCSRMTNGGDYEKSFREIVQKSGAKVFWIHINPPEEFIINKLKNYAHTWLFKNGDHAVERYLFHKKGVNKEGIPFIYTFDTSRNDIEKQAKEAARIIERELRSLS